jgi:glycosyltransferase involved in cell wall biosynthesis
LLSPIQERVPPEAYGGVESVIALLADGLVDAGHDVTLFAQGGSKTKAQLVAVVDELPERPGRRIIAEVEHALACFLRANEFDLVNSHMGVLGAAAAKDGGTPVAHTVSDAVSRTRDVWTKAVRHSPQAKLISISQRQQELAPNLPWIANCPNAVDLGQFEFHPEADGYAAFLGRMSPDKGCDVAIDVARRAGIPLKIGAKLRDEHEQEYFEQDIRPLLDGDVEFLGEVSQEEKVELLGRATAALFPSDVEEAFGLVLAEAMACGTPVVALDCGAVAEVVADGSTGYVVGDACEMVAALGKIDRIDRAECRRHVERHFSPERLVAHYERAYARLLVTT